MKLKMILKELMETHRINLTELANETKVPKQTLHNWLCGSEPRNLDQVRKIALHFGISIEGLCYGEEHTKEPSINDFKDEINAGVFEVVLKRVKR